MENAVESLSFEKAFARKTQRELKELVVAGFRTLKVQQQQRPLNDPPKKRRRCS